MNTNGKEFRLLSIELYNMFNYRNLHNIDFTTDRGGNIFLFDIKNGGGKTSLFLSIKWGFYGFNSGVSYKKDGKELTSQDFMNQDEQEEGQFRVRIRFVYDGKDVELRRVCTDYKKSATELTLRINGVMVRDNPESHIVQMIPPDYGDFFMFDGETLNVIADNQRDKTKSDSVLKLLGLKQLDDLRMMLTKVRDEYNSQIISKKIVGIEASAIQTRIDEKRSEIDRAKNDLKIAKDVVGGIEGRIRELEHQRNEFSSVENTCSRLKSLDANIMHHEDSIEHNMGLIESRCNDAFLLFLKDDIKSLLDELLDEHKSTSKELNKPSIIQNEYTNIHRAIINHRMDSCPVCKSFLSPEQLDMILSLLRQPVEDKEKYDGIKSKVAKLDDMISVLRTGLDRVPSQLNDIFDKIFEAKEALAQDISQRDHLNSILEVSKVDSMKEISGELSSLYSKLPNKRAAVVKLDRMVKAGESKIQELIRDLAKQQGLDSNQALMIRRSEFISNLVSSLKQVIDKVKKSKRQSILDKANEVFMSITNKPSVYSGLRYESVDSFSMQIVRRDGMAVYNPSSGEKHVLAISFLISLSLNSERTSPMMMDTPLSRLDLEHKSNIGRTLAGIQNQVLFLAQPGELDADTRESLRPAVSKMFESRPTDDNTACIREVML